VPRTVFQVGERVRLHAAIAVARAGAIGTIEFVYRSVRGLYEVQFDGYTRPRLMQARDLEHADQERRS
jgi:hypothetical protein